MAETATKTATPRNRTRSKAPAKTAATATVPAKAETPTEAAPEPQKVAVKLGEAFDETKTYAKFKLDKDANGNSTGMVGTLYAPLGTREVRVLLVGGAEDESGE